MDQSAAAFQLAGDLQRSGSVVSALRGTRLVVDTSQPNAWEDLLLSLRESDDYKDLKLGESEAEFRYMGIRFAIINDEIITYIDAMED